MVPNVTWLTTPFQDPATFDPHWLQKTNPPSSGAYVFTSVSPDNHLKFSGSTPR
jgi:hypothetical protein